MANKFLVAIDLNQNELQNVKIQNLASDPGSPTVGQIWYNTTANKLKLYDGTANRTLAELNNTLNDFASPAADLSINSHKLTNVADPTTASDAATKGYVDSVALGLDVKASVRVATTAAGTLASSFANSSVVDGITLATGDRILIKNQAAASENGIYIVAASGAPTRSSDCNSSTNYITGAFVFVEQGTVNAGSSWVVQTQGTITVGTTGVTWVQFTGGTTYSAGSGLTLTGSTFSVNVTNNSIEISSNNLRVKSSATSGQALLSQGSGAEAAYGALNLGGGSSIVSGQLPVANGGTGSNTAAGARANLGATTKYSATIGDNSTTSIVVNHALGTTDVVVEVNETASPFRKVFPEIQVTDSNNVTVIFTTAPTTGQYRVEVVA